MTKKITISSHWTNPDQPVLIDVRTPAEYEKGHIPSAVNLPLFSNEERAVVGTLFIQTGPEEALLKGLDFVGPKMSGFIRQVKELAPNKKVTIYCWRGGKRSFSLSWLLALSGFEVQTLEGGYKAYRNFVLNGFAAFPKKIIILGGRTGCGKTEILQELKNRSEQVIDLEGLAHHKGSAFGWVGQLPQPSVEQFENNLFEIYRHTDPDQWVWVENESRNIGKIFLPENFWDQMKAAPLINISLPFEERLDILMEQYGLFQKDMLVQSFEKIKKRLGGLQFKEALEALDQDDIRSAASIALKYYDKSYQRLLEKNNSPMIKHLSFNDQTSAEIAEQLIHFANSTDDLATFNYESEIHG